MFKKLVVFIALALFAIASSANAQCEPGGPIELCVAIDGSGSISGSDFTLQLEGLAQAIEDSSVVPQDGRAKISVVQFSLDSALEVPLTAIDSQTAADSVATAIRNISQMNDLTNFSAAINECMGSFSDPLAPWVIDLSTDGVLTAGPDPMQTRDAAVTAGLDILNALGIGPYVDVNFLNDLVWPQPVSPPYAPGFVVLVNNFTEYVTAIREKIRAEIITENCNNGADDDCDGFIDKEDEDCWICGDGIQDPNEECDDGNRINGDNCDENCINENQPPDCSDAYAFPGCLWPPNHQYPMMPVNVIGVTDPDGDAVTLTINSITSDEPTATIKGAGGTMFAPDASGVGTGSAMIRAERSGLKDGRVYIINFTADDGNGGICAGSVVVNVPHDMRSPDCRAIDSGQKYDATKIN